MMRATMAGCAALALLTGCGDAADPAADAADVAEIRAEHDMPPVVPFDPERISYTDIEANNLFGAGCGFAPEGSLSVIFLGQEDHGFVKLDGRIVTFAPDKGSAELPLRSWSRYTGKEHSIEIGIAPGEGEPDGIETSKWPGTMTVRDYKDRVVFEKAGVLGCGS